MHFSECEQGFGEERGVGAIARAALGDSAGA